MTDLLMFELRIIISVGLLCDQIVELLLRNQIVKVSISSLNHLLKSVIVSQLS